MSTSTTPFNTLDQRTRDRFVSILGPLEAMGKLGHAEIEDVFQLHPDAIMKGHSIKHKAGRWRLLSPTGELKSSDTAIQLIEFIAEQNQSPLAA